MKLIKVLFFADSHLAESAWVRCRIVGDSEESLKQIVDYAVDHGVDAVIGGGDLLDRQRNRSYPIVAFSRQIDRLAEAGIPFYYIVGQHDADSPPWLSVNSHAVHVGGEYFQVGGRDFYGIDHCDSRESWLGALEELRTREDGNGRIQTVNGLTLVTHQAWRDWVPEHMSHQAMFSDLPYSTAALFNGDWHSIENTPAHGESDDAERFPALSPGSTCMQDIRETNEKCFVVATYAKNNPIPSEEFVDLKTREVIDVLVQDDVTAEAFLLLVKRYCPDPDAPDIGPLAVPLFRVKVDGEFDDARHAARRHLKQFADHVFWLDASPAAAEEAAAAEEFRDTAPDELAAVAAAVPEGSDPEVAKLAAAMVKVKRPPLDAFNDWREEFEKGS